MKKQFRFRKAPFLAMCLSYAIFAISFSVGAFFFKDAYAYDSDAALEADGRLCTQQITRSERQYGIPLRLLGAVAATESGRWHKGLGVKVPWPWTINAEGKPYLFHTKREAVQMVEKLRAQGVKSIDVGCMQVNLHHHPNAFANLSKAFDPASNVDYAARFLRSNYDETGSWKEAVGHYHSRTPLYGDRYIALVYDQWYGLSTKVANGRRNNYTTASASKYRSYVKLEGSGKQVELAPGRTRTVSAGEAKIIRSAKREPTKSHFDLSIIRPASAAEKIETAPTGSREDASGPLVMSGIEKEKVAASPKILSVSANGKVTGDQDSRFIRFVD